MARDRLVLVRDYMSARNLSAAERRKRRQLCASLGAEALGSSPAKFLERGVSENIKKKKRVGDARCHQW